jgi:uncharacterized protein with HEPN domain
MESDNAYLDDILDAAKQVSIYIADMDREAFLADRKTQDAVVRQIEIMGEAATRISDTLKASHPGVDWRGLSRLRNFYIHVYRLVNYRNVWQTCRNTIPQIKRDVERIIAPVQESE